MLALLDTESAAHGVLLGAFRSCRDEWVLPWAILPELDHLVPGRVGPAVAEAFRVDLAEELYTIEWGGRSDLQRALELHHTYRDLSLGLVDGVVMAVAERLEARAIATLDLRDFGAVTLNGNPEIWPRDLPAPPDSHPARPIWPG